MLLSPETAVSLSQCWTDQTDIDDLAQSYGEQFIQQISVEFAKYCVNILLKNCFVSLKKKTGCC